MSQARNFSAYFVVGPENAQKHSLKHLLECAVFSGFTCIQIRSKTASARELIDITAVAADVISSAPQKVLLLVNDRLDVVLAAREQGIIVDGIHIGQSDIPVSVCRKYLGDESIVGLSAKTTDMLTYISTSNDKSYVDYFGIGPLRETLTKTDCGKDSFGNISTCSFDFISDMVKACRTPLVVGGGVKLHDITELAKTGVAGFFVVSAISGAPNPKDAALELVRMWNDSVRNK